MRALAREFSIDPSAISRLGVAHQSQQVKSVAQQIAAAQSALAELPIAQQHTAMTLADRLRNISADLAGAAAYGAATAHHLSRIANGQAIKVNESEPMESQEVLQGIGALNRLANDSASIGMQLLSGNKDAAKRAGENDPPPPSLDPSKLSSQALQELLAARG